MSRFFIHEITIYHFQEGTASSGNDQEVILEHYPNVYFRHVVGIKDFTKGVITDCSGTITIPTTAELDISEGDIVIEGTIDDEYDFRELVKKYTVYKVLKVHDNRKGKLQHYKLEVKD